MAEGLITNCPFTGRRCEYRVWLAEEASQTDQAAASYRAAYRSMSLFERTAHEPPRSMKAGFRKFGQIVGQVLREEQPELECGVGFCGTAVSITRELGSKCLPGPERMTFGNPAADVEPPTETGVFNQE